MGPDPMSIILRRSQRFGSSRSISFENIWSANRPNRVPSARARLQTFILQLFSFYSFILWFFYNLLLSLFTLCKHSNKNFWKRTVNFKSYTRYNSIPNIPSVQIRLHSLLGRKFWHFVLHFEVIEFRLFLLLTVTNTLLLQVLVEFREVRL